MSSDAGEAFASTALLALAMAAKAKRSRRRVRFCSVEAKRWSPEVPESVEECMLRLGWRICGVKPPKSAVLDLRRFLERSARACGFDYSAVHQAPRDRFDPEDAAKWAAIIGSGEIAVEDVNAVLEPRRLGGFFFTKDHFEALATALFKYPLHNFVPVNADADSDEEDAEEFPAFECDDCYDEPEAWCSSCEACLSCAEQKEPWGQYCNLQPDRTDPLTAATPTKRAVDLFPPPI